MNDELVGFNPGDVAVPLSYGYGAGKPGRGWHARAPGLVVSARNRGDLIVPSSLDPEGTRVVVGGALVHTSSRFFRKENVTTVARG